MNLFKVRCLGAKYDENNGMLVMNTLFEHSGEKKIVIFSKDDVSQGIFKKPDIGHQNMHYFARCMEKREDTFSLSIDDDPNRKVLSDEELMSYGATFNKRIAEELEGVKEGLSDDRGQMQRKLGRMRESGKLNVLDLLKEESIVRGKIGGI